MNAQTQNILSSFDQLPEPLQYQVAIEILRRLSAGPNLESAIVELQQKRPGAPSYPLRGKPVKLEDPFEPVAVDDWDALS